MARETDKEEEERRKLVGFSFHQCFTCRSRSHFVCISERRRSTSRSEALASSKFELICGPFERMQYSFDEHILQIASIGWSGLIRCDCFNFIAATAGAVALPFAVWMCFLPPRAAFACFISLVHFLSVCCWLCCVCIFVLNSISNRRLQNTERSTCLETNRSRSKAESTFLFGKPYLPFGCGYLKLIPLLILNSAQFTFK